MPMWLQLTIMLYLGGVIVNIITPFPYHFMKKEWKAGVFDHYIDFRNAPLSARSWLKLWLIRLGSFAVPAYMIAEQIAILIWETSQEPKSSKRSTR